MIKEYNSPSDWLNLAVWYYKEQPAVTTAMLVLGYLFTEICPAGLRTFTWVHMLSGAVFTSMAAPISLAMTVICWSLHYWFFRTLDDVHEVKHNFSETIDVMHLRLTQNSTDPEACWKKVQEKGKNGKMVDKKDVATGASTLVMPWDSGRFMYLTMMRMNPFVSDTNFMFLGTQGVGTAEFLLSSIIGGFPYIFASTSLGWYLLTGSITELLQYEYNKYIVTVVIFSVPYYLKRFGLIPE